MLLFRYVTDNEFPLHISLHTTVYDLNDKHSGPLSGLANNLANNSIYCQIHKYMDSDRMTFFVILRLYIIFVIAAPYSQAQK